MSSFDSILGGLPPAPLNMGPPAAAPAAAAAPPAAAAALSPASAAGAAQAAMQVSQQHPRMAMLEQQLEKFWDQQMKDVVHLCATNSDFKNHNDLPLARIKRIMKSDEDVRMIRAEAPVLFAKACELFILELTVRSSAFSEQTERRNLQKTDILHALAHTDIFDFLYDVLSQSEAEKQQNAAKKAADSAAAAGQ